MSAVARNDVQRDKPATFVALPFRLRKDLRPFLEYDYPAGGRTVAYYVQVYQPEFAPICRLMEMFRELERSVGLVINERDSLVVEIGRLRDEMSRKDAKVAELERRLQRTKRETA